MKKIFVLLSTLAVLMLAGCSNIIHDLKNLNSGTAYTVNHMFQNINDDEYTLGEEETLYGKPEELTDAKVKSFEGFSLKEGFEVTQSTIAEDGSTVIEIKYDRNLYSIEFNPDGGLWNYDEAKADSAVEKKNSSIILKGRYESKVRDADGYPDFAKLKKKAHTFDGWQKDGESTVVKEDFESTIPETFAAYEKTAVEGSGIVYTAKWTLTGTKYTVKHLVESLDGSSYELYESKELGGEEGDFTEALPIDIDGFEKPDAASVTQKEIAADGSTEIEIKYTRKSYNVVIDLNGGMWNYKQYKADNSIEPNIESKSVPVKFGAQFNLSNYLNENVGKKSSSIGGWYKDGDTTVCVETANAVIEEMPARAVEYKAVWSQKNVKYTIVYKLQNAEDDNYTEAKEYETECQGLPEATTAVSLSEGENVYTIRDITGFTKPAKIDNVEIAADGSTKVYVLYTRNTYSISLNLDEGYWNYKAYKDDSSVTLKGEQKIVNVRYGASIAYPDLSSLGKRSHELKGWLVDDTETLVTELPAVMTSTKNISYTASWKRLSNVTYTVKHFFEKADSKNDALDGNYEEDSLYEETKTGVAEMNTEAVAQPVDGFTPKDIIQQEIASDGSTVVKVMYKRNIIKIKFDLDGGVWNFDEAKAGGTADRSIKEVSGKFGAAIDYSTIPFSSKGRKNYTFNNWKRLDSGLFTSGDTGLVETYPSVDVTYEAKWIENPGIAYKVEHYFEKTNAANTTDEKNFEIDNSLTQILKGPEDDETDAQPKTVDGFTAKAITQGTIAGDGSTIVKVFYTRNESKLIFKANGGTWKTGGNSNVTVTGKYGNSVNSSSIPVVTRSGWTFGGWNEYNGEVDSVFGLEDKIYEAYWTSSITQGMKFNGDISATITRNGTTTKGTVKLPAGYESENWTYAWYIDKIYYTDTAVFERTDAQLGVGVHTITVKASMPDHKSVFTKQFTIVVE